MDPPTFKEAKPSQSEERSVSIFEFCKAAGHEHGPSLPRKSRSAFPRWVSLRIPLCGVALNRQPGV